MSSSSSNDNSVRIRDYANAKISETTSERAAESIKNVAMGIVEASSSIRELVLTLHQSGAIEEIARATRSIRDTVNEVNDTVKNLNERGIIKDTASAVGETTNSTQNTIHIVKDATREAAETAPTTIKTLKEVSDKVRSKLTAQSCPPKLEQKQMAQLLVKCKNCGVEFLAATQMNEETFEAISIGNTNESCPNCKRTFAYIKTDYYFK